MMNLERRTLLAAGGAALAMIGTALVRRRAMSSARGAANLRSLLREGKKCVAIGKNYCEHITELAQLGPEWKLEEEPEPILFIKPTTAYAWPGEPLVLPRKRARPLGTGASSTHGVHHELELGVIIGQKAKDVTDEASAMDCVAGYVVGLDITERDEQTAAKVKGMPWSVSKGYDSFLPLSEPFALSAGEDWKTLRLWLDVNGERRQACDAGTMIHSVPSLIVYISSIMTLEPGDLILTGTPAGVGPLVAGDRVVAGVKGHAEMAVDVVRPPARRLSDPFIHRTSPPLAEGGASRALAGFTFSAKDNLAVAGLPTGNGSPDWARSRGVAAATHSPVVAAMLAAGAQLTGKTHMDELAFSIGGENAHYGSLGNPFDADLTVGGSSSGAAVSVATGAVDVALGSDTTGSVRVPASHCGLYGMRPTHGALSADGVCILAATYDTVGWFARTASALAAVGDVLLPPALPSVPTGKLPSVLVATDALALYEAGDPRTTSAARERVLKAAATLAGPAASEVRHIQLGAALLDRCPTLRGEYANADGGIDGLTALCNLMREEQAGEIWEALGAWCSGGEGSKDRRPKLGDDVIPRLMWARDTATSESYPLGHTRRQQARAEVKNALNAMLSDGSVLCFIPVAAPPPPPYGALDPGYRARTFTLQGPAGVAGIPQMVVPAGACPHSKLPLAVTLLGASGHDRRLLSFGAALSEALAT